MEAALWPRMRVCPVVFTSAQGSVTQPAHGPPAHFVFAQRITSYYSTAGAAHYKNITRLILLAAAVPRHRFCLIKRPFHFEILVQRPHRRTG